MSTCPEFKYLDIFLVIRMVVPLKAESQMAEEKKAEKTV
jgi:hypothetical protein